MLKERAGQTVNVSHRANGQYPELRQHSEALKDVYQSIHDSGLYKFTFARVDSLWNGLCAILYDLEQMPEEAFIEMMEVIEGLRTACNELRLARFLFDVEEINPVHRLVMRNRAVLRSEGILEKILHVWPVHA